MSLAQWVPFMSSVIHYLRIEMKIDYILGKMYIPVFFFYKDPLTPLALSFVSKCWCLCLLQEKRISSLDAANSRLMSALTQVKERYSMHNLRNGLSPTNPTKLSITENGEFKNSSCWLVILNVMLQDGSLTLIGPLRDGPGTQITYVAGG